MEDVLSLLEDVLGESERKSRGNYRFKCPHQGCTSVRNRFEIQTEITEEGHNPWKCWVCLKGGLTIKSLFHQIRADARFYQRLSNITGKTYARQNSSQFRETLTLPSEFKPLNNIKDREYIGRQAMAYLKKRGFTKDTILKYQLGYCDSGKYKNRIIIPSFDQGGNLNYFIARSFIDDEEYRYDYPSVERGSIIPFELYINWSAPIILCEGPFDAMAIFRNAIPLLEKGITPALLSRILGSEVDKIYIVLDKDGMKEALQHADMLLSNGKTVYLVELDKKDPSDMGFEGFTNLIQQAKALNSGTLFLKKMLFKLS